MSSSRSLHAWWAPYAFIAPFILLFAVFTVYPLLYSVVMATQQNFGPNRSEFVGLDNFRWLWEDREFRLALRNTFVFAAGSIFLQLPCALGLAILLNRPEIKARGLFRLIFFAPVLVGLAFVAIMFGLIFEKNTGLINVLLHDATAWVNGFLPFVGVWDREFPWLQEYIMVALIIASFWMYLGYNMVYFLAALQNVSQDLLEAAKVDGANAWHRFLYVTIPAIRPIATFVFLLSFIGAMQLFELPYLLLDPGGGKDQAGLTVVMYLYDKGFNVGNLGYASAIGWVLAMILFFSAIVQKIVGRVEER
ncbi:MAG: sugar ABC transporter permease [Planctomycetota bacterium]